MLKIENNHKKLINKELKGDILCPYFCKFYQKHAYRPLFSVLT